MAAATDPQMQSYADQRIRVRSEQLRSLQSALSDDQQAIPDIFARASGGPAWNDARTDGPPHLLASADVLAYNVVSALLLKCFLGTATLADIAAIASNWGTIQKACVRGIG
jgi:hypothetical protein